MAKSIPFNAGAQTSAWLSFRAYTGNNQNTQSIIALGLSGTNLCLGLTVDSGTVGKLALFKYDGTTKTQLASETGTSLVTNTPMRFDMQVTSYGASATVNVYLNNTSLISFTGNVAVSGMTNFDSVFVNAIGSSSGNTYVISECFVADSDTRAVQGVQTLALTGAGTTNNWTNNTYTNINGTSYSDSNPTSVNTTGTDQQYNVTDPTPASFTVAAVQISARMAKGLTSTPTQVKLGYNSGGSVAFGTGAAKTVTTAYNTYQQIDATNPVTGNAFTPSELTALQFDLQSA
jgi:hypothetical protein